MMPFSVEQVEQLLHPINPTRVLKDGKGHSHVSQQDVTAHLIRVFGFGNFDTEVLFADLVFESERTDKPGRYDVCYRAMVRLTVRDAEGKEVCSFENGSTATAQNQTRGDAHDLAYKSAISLSVKRAAIALGDQFGLSLYNKGQTSALVLGTLVGRGTPEAKRDMQDGVPQQVSLGNDEIDTEDEAVPAEPPPKPPGTKTMSRKKTTPALVEPEPVSPESPPPVAGMDMITGQQSKMLHALLNTTGMGERVAGLAFLSDVVNRVLTTTKELSKDEAHHCIEELVRLSETPFEQARVEAS